MPRNEALIEAIRRHMEFRHLDNRKLAKKAGLAENTISRIFNEEDHEPSSNTIERIAIEGFGLNDTSEIWIDPFAIPPTINTRAQLTSELNEWLDNPNARAGGKPAPDWFKDMVRTLLKNTIDRKTGGEE